MEVRDKEWYEKGLQENIIYISKEDYDFIIDKINNPPEPNERLRKLMQDFKKSQVEAPAKYDKVFSDNWPDFLA